MAPPTPQTSTLSLHDALPISDRRVLAHQLGGELGDVTRRARDTATSVGHDLSVDRKSTRLNSSHVSISYAVFCLKKKKNSINHTNYDTISCLTKIYI